MSNEAPVETKTRRSFRKPVLAVAAIATAAAAAFVLGRKGGDVNLTDLTE